MLRSLVMMRSTSSIETSRSPNHSFMSLTYAANALAPLILPRVGSCTSGSPLNEPAIASVSPVSRPA